MYKRQHHTNATGDLAKYPECRGVCVDEAVNNNPEIYAELICDSRGIHVDPYMLRLVRRIKGDARIILISDAYASDGPIPPGDVYKRQGKGRGRALSGARSGHSPWGSCPCTS